MYEQILSKMQQAAQGGRVYLSRHAQSELRKDALTFADVINCILTGEIVKQQYDADYGDYKYIVYGDSKDEMEMGVTAKLAYNDRVGIITVCTLTITDYD